MKNHIPCPFCKAENTRFAHSDTLGEAVVCNKCGARSDWYASKAAASRAWNKGKIPTSVYTVTVCMKMEDSCGWGDLGSCRVVGFYFNEADAVASVLNNAGDMFEMTYNYAIIEKINEGVYGVDIGYVPRVFRAEHRIDAPIITELEKIPSFLNNIRGISIG